MMGNLYSRDVQVYAGLAVYDDQLNLFWKPGMPGTSGMGTPTGDPSYGRKPFVLPAGGRQVTARLTMPAFNWGYMGRNPFHVEVELFSTLNSEPSVLRSAPVAIFFGAFGPG